MNTPLHHPHTPAARTRQHPMMMLAALAVIVFCLAGTAAILGWIPSSFGGASSGELTASDRAALASRLADTASPPPGAGNLAPSRDNERLALLDSERASSERLHAERERELADLERERSLERERALADLERERARDRALAAARERDTEPVVRERVAQAAPKATCSNCGRVIGVRTIKQRAEGSGLGAAGGAVLGGLLGNQIGDGSGRKIATVAGAVGGAVVGNQVEGNMKARTSYQVSVRLDNGKERSFTLQNLNGFSSGDRIRIVDGSLRHAN
ncbi:glycine zipper 2TM domain-containing protein [Massilia sp. PAMC28688]|uniref:glycine zipper 2TM domain-containing protein n=1 Tax=Massilia sp. PAMC28688 TaxID=2861283 RepID=UPI001C62ECB9|nr:glycine zipper 2TM domain-containing protein [Massilia sp. PAMC28688]QYF93834.1 glycine zipper 2TM domain-containing protein [Massilia sp. PAMC28688]